MSEEAFSRDHEPERPTDRASLGPEATQAINAVLARLTHVEDELRVVEGALTHGPSFAAWLLLADTAAQEPTLVRRYEQSYASSWDSLDGLVEKILEAAGWAAAFAEFKRANAIRDDDLTWNYPALRQRLDDLYRFVELDGIIHAFHR